ncbi:MAG TPA: peptidase, partial [Sphingomonas sp.]
MVRLWLVAGAAGIAAVGAGSARADCDALIPQSAAVPISARDVTATDLIALRNIGPPDGSNPLAPSPFGLSPDGRRLAFVLSRDDPATGEYCQALVVLAVDKSGSPQVVDRGGDRILQNLALRGSRISAGWPAVVTPHWSPDGRAVGYLKRSNGVNRVWVSFGAGTPSVPVSPADSDVLDWRWGR